MNASLAPSSPTRLVTNAAASTVPWAERVGDGEELAPRVVDDEVDRELLHQRRDRDVRIGLGAHAGDDDAPVELRRADADGGHPGEAHALDHDVVARLERLGLGIDGAGGTELLGRLTTDRGRIGHDELTGATPRRPRDHRESDRPGSHHQHRVAGADVRALDRVQPDGERLDQRTERGVEGLGQRDRLPLVDADDSAKPPGLPPTPTMSACSQCAGSPARHARQ